METLNIRKIAYLVLLVFILLNSVSYLVHTEASTGLFDWWVHNVTRPSFYVMVGGGCTYAFFQLVKDALLGEPSCKCKNK